MRYDKGPGRNYSDSANFEALEAVLSHERLHKYLREADADLRGALQLYDWNTSVSAAFYEVLQWVEITLRNAIHRCLSCSYGDEWYFDPRVGLDHASRGQLENALGRLRQERKPLRAPDIVASLSFGFWIGLLGPGGLITASGPKADYERTLWRAALRRVFPYQTSLTRKNVHKSLDYLRTLRNRIAHHEPIFHRDLARDHARILEVTGWMSPVVSERIKQNTRVPRLLRGRSG